MSALLDVSADVRAEIGEDEAERLLTGDNSPGNYDCTSCRNPGDAVRERTSTVLFVGEETAVLAFAHAACIPSQVVPVSEEQLKGAVRSITGQGGDIAAGAQEAGGQAVLGVTCGLVIVDDELYASLVVEPNGSIARPGSDASGDEFLPLMIEQGFFPVTSVASAPAELTGWSVLLVGGELHAVLQPGLVGSPSTAWWQAHQPLPVTEGWRNAARQRGKVLLLASPAGTIGTQPREDLLRDALDQAAEGGRLVGAVIPLAGT